MVVLYTLLGAASFAGFATALAKVPQPSTGQAQLSSQLKQREINRMDIVRRASRMKKRAGPSAVPAPPIQRCGDFFPGQTFYLTSPDFSDDTRYSYLSTSTYQIDEFSASTFSFTGVQLAATPFVFNDACEITVTGNINEGTAYVWSSTNYAEVRIGTEGYIDQEEGNAVACIVQDGSLRCGTDQGTLPLALPLGDSQFCRSFSGTLQLASTDPSIYGCTPITLSVTSTPPPQPVPKCGDYPINTPFYLSTPNPANPAYSYIYGRAEDGNINYAGSSPFYSNTVSTLATPFTFDEDCSLIRTTDASGRATFTVSEGAPFAVPNFQTSAVIDEGGSETLTCISVDGNLQCISSAITVEKTRFCTYGDVYITITSTEITSCIPIDLAVTSIAPVAIPPP